MYDIRYDDGDLIFGMLVDSEYSYSYDICCMHNGYIMILGKDNIDKFRNIMVESGYIKYIEIVGICDSNNNIYMYSVRLNELGNKERDSIESLFKLKGLLE